MNQIRSLALIASLAIGCSAPGPVVPVRAGAAHDLPVVQGASYLGVVFPADRATDTVRFLGMQVDEYWTPGRSEIEQLEANLRDALERGAQDPSEIDRSSDASPLRRNYVTREVGRIIEHLAEYRRQYVGIVTPDGSKRIVVNCFPGHHGEAEDPFSGWRQHFVTVSDGGFWFWNIQYDVATRRYLAFNTNGYA